MSGRLSQLTRKVSHVIIAAGFLVAMATAAGLFPAATPHAADAVIDPQTVRAQQADQKNPFLLDVREADEYAAGHIDGATLIPLGDLKARVSELPKDREIVVYCRSGRRSATAVETLHALGYDKAVSLAGGYTAWTAAAQK